MTVRSAAVARRALALLALGALPLASCAPIGPRGSSPADVKVGPPRGSVVVVGGGALGPEIYAKFIELAGGPDALIVDVPTSGGADTYTQDTPGARAFRAAGAKNVRVLHTTDRKIADADSFVAPLTKAGGVWFDGGRHYRLVDSYAGTKTEKAFHDILARGGVAGGSSAGASILGSYLVRGAPSNNNAIMAYPGYEVGFGFLRGVGIDQHVVARERLADLADSIMPKHPGLLLISEDEGTAWVVQGDVAEIIGRNKAFVYGGRDKPDSAKPFLTLRPGDKYNLATRRVIHRAIEETRLTQQFVDSLFKATVGSSAATVLVAQGGKVLVNTSYGVPPQRNFMPTTTMPNFDLRRLSDALNGSIAMSLAREGKLSVDEPLEDGGTVTMRQFLSGEREVAGGDKKVVALLAKKGGQSYAQLATRRLLGPAGTHKTEVDTASGAFRSNVDELYRLERAVFNTGARSANGNDGGASAGAFGGSVDRYRGLIREAGYGTPDGKRNAFVRFPERGAAIIVLTHSDAVDARTIADRIADRFLFTP